MLVYVLCRARWMSCSAPASAQWLRVLVRSQAARISAMVWKNLPSVWVGDPTRSMLGKATRIPGRLQLRIVQQTPGNQHLANPHGSPPGCEGQARPGCSRLRATCDALGSIGCLMSASTAGRGVEVLTEATEPSHHDHDPRRA